MNPFLQGIADAGPAVADLVGGKAARLGQLSRAGLNTPRGLVLTVEAYEAFVEEARLGDLIHMELGRKDLASMRWEELWDAALRIRSAFDASPLPAGVLEALKEAARLAPRLAVRSSAPAEDGQGATFAGLHASLLDVSGVDELARAVKAVWASLWSDAALLYRRELELDPFESRMAVVIQEMVDGDRSGVAFGVDPRSGQERFLIEAVRGPCAALVEGRLEPEHYALDPATGIVLERRGEGGELLSVGELDDLRTLLIRLHHVCGWAVDAEWTLSDGRLTVLQARPAGSATLPVDGRRAYMGYRLSAGRLEAMTRRVEDELIPALQAEGERLAAEGLSEHSDQDLAAAILERQLTLEGWQATYGDVFIPFAHGVRALGLSYQEAVAPDDPYEFLGLLVGGSMLALERNDVLRELGEALEAPELNGLVSERLAADAGWSELLELLRAQGQESLVARLSAQLDGALDVVYGEERLAESPAMILRPLLSGLRERSRAPSEQADVRDVLEARFFAAVGEEGRVEAEEQLRIGRLSWRLRDDDNLLLGRLESQLLRAVRAGEARLRAAGRLQGSPARLEDAARVASALSAGERKLVLCPPETTEPAPFNGRPRQLVGQPAAPGMAMGKVRIVRGGEDLLRFEAGDVLVCDAIEPQITQLVLLASAVVERRGGMLIHGSIIARELGVPCVNGIESATTRLRDGQLVTVDGDLGIVTVGRAEFELERFEAPRQKRTG